MKIQKFNLAPALLISGALALSTCFPAIVVADASVPYAIDSSAVHTLKRMTDYLGNLKQFSVHTQVTLEDVTEFGHRIDMDVSSSVIIKRPNKLRAERRGDPIDQTLYYDGKYLTLYNPGDKVYATTPAPTTIEEMLDYTRESLGLVVPVADLIYHNAYDLLIQDIDFAMVVGKTVINGNTCTHLLFSRPGVDFQVWVADSDEALPCKYLVTDTGNPGLLSVTTVMSDWNLSPVITDKEFTFTPPQEAKPIGFMSLDIPGITIH